jgi:hypothetical protein
MMADKFAGWRVEDARSQSFQPAKISGSVFATENDGIENCFAFRYIQNFLNVPFIFLLYAMDVFPLKAFY